MSVNKGVREKSRSSRNRVTAPKIYIVLVHSKVAETYVLGAFSTARLARAHCYVERRNLMKRGKSGHSLEVTDITIDQAFHDTGHDDAIQSILDLIKKAGS